MFFLGLALFLLAHLCIPVTGQSCYFPDGTFADNHAPCNTSLHISPCCGSSETCLSNGLCLQSGFLSRGSCTDKSWGPGCPTYCRDNEVSGGTGVQWCGPGTLQFTCDDCESDNFTIADYHIVLRKDELQSAVSAAGDAIAASTGSASATRSSEIAAADLTAATTTVTVTAPASTGSASTTTRSSGIAAAALTAATTTVTVTAPAEASRLPDSQGTSDTGSREKTALLGVSVGVALPLFIAVVALALLLYREKQNTRRILGQGMPPLVETLVEKSDKPPFPDTAELGRYAEMGDNHSHYLHGQPRHEMESTTRR